MEQFIVAIDGGAGSGKSTTAKGLARRLRFLYLDTGAMYRAVTLKYLTMVGTTTPIDMTVIRHLIENTEIDLQPGDPEIRVYLDGKDVSAEIRSPKINELVSSISALPEIRTWMVAMQRRAAANHDVVCEGRDIGTVVFPNAQVKLYLQADLNVRAQRRVKEFSAKNMGSNMTQVLENLEYRDRYDSNREHSPLKKAADATVIDTTDLTIEQEITIAENIVRARMNDQPRS